MLTVLRYDTVAQAVEIANATDYGLAAAVLTHDIGQALQLIKQLEAGYVWVNTTSTHFRGMPFGGVKDSGVGRDESLEELLSYTTAKAVNLFAL